MVASEPQTSHEYVRAAMTVETVQTLAAEIIHLFRACKMTPARAGSAGQFTRFTMALMEAGWTPPAQTDDEFGITLDPCEHPSINGGVCAVCGVHIDGTEGGHDAR